jgi:RNA polymerase sigma-70 factor (ECF subfamily)
MTDALEPADEHLVSLSKDGNLGAFNSLVERYQSAVYNLCRRLTGDPGAAEDATQEAFLSAYRSIVRFEGGSFRSWLLRIAANECKDELRRRSRRPAESLRLSPLEDEQQFDLPDTSESAPDYVERIALGESIQSALLLLPFEQRQAILLSDLHGYHYEEIAEMTGANVGTVKSRIHRGRERLRVMLAEDPELFGRLRRLEQ